jgi:Rrf2 family nitric oxide-sensitive transcriptional repressor
MKLTDYTDYSLRVLLYTAVHPDTLVTIQQIADIFGIPKNHLIKIVQRLGQAGFLHTMRGRAGGIRLGKPPEHIVIGDVIRATEPDFKMVQCFRDPDGDHGGCAIQGVCALQGVLSDALQAYFMVLDGVTLADVVKQPALANALGGTALVPLTTLRPSAAKGPRARLSA